MHKRFNQTTYFHEGENMGFNEQNFTNYLISTSTNDIAHLNNNNKAFNLDMTESKFQQPAPFKRHQLYSKRVTKTKNYGFDEDVYTLDSNYTNWHGRFSKGMIEFAKTSSPFYGGESLEKYSYNDHNHTKYPKPTEGSRAAFWKGKTLPKSNKTFKDIIIRLCQISFWWQISKNLWRSKTKKFYSTLFFISLYLIPMIYLFISLWSYIPMIENEWKGLFHNKNSKLPILTDTIDISKIQNFIQKTEVQQEAFNHQNGSEIDDIYTSLKKQLDYNTDKSITLLKSISSLETKISNLENSVLSIRSKDINGMQEQFNNLKTEFLSSSLNNYIESSYSIDYNKTFEDIASFLSDSFNNDIKNEIEELKVLLKDHLTSEISTISKKIQNDTVTYLDKRLSEINTEEISDHSKSNNNNSAKSNSNNNPTLDIQQQRMSNIEYKLSQLFNQHFMDSTGQVDWALQSLGAKIIHSETSPALNTDDWFESVLNFIGNKLPSDVVSDMIKPMGKPPEVVLQPDVNPGQCFAFSGNSGTITIRLPATINVSSVTLEHVHKDINNNIGSTPKYFKVFGVPDPRWPDAFENAEGQYDNGLKSSCSYDNSGCIIHSTTWLDWTTFWKRMKSIWNKQNQIQEIGDFYFDNQLRIQSYPIKSNFPMNRITFKFINNYGGSYTCIYRIRVHGNKIQRKSLL